MQQLLIMTACVDISDDAICYMINSTQ